MTMTCHHDYDYHDYADADGDGDGDEYGNPQRAAAHGQQVLPVLAAESPSCLITKFDHTFHDHTIQMIMVLIIMVIYDTNNVSVKKVLQLEFTVEKGHFPVALPFCWVAPPLVGLHPAVLSPLSHKSCPSRWTINSCTKQM